MGILYRRNLTIIILLVALVCSWGWFVFGDSGITGNVVAVDSVSKGMVDGDYYIGDGIVIEIFSDFQCPYCKQSYEVFKQIREEYSGEVRLVFNHLPLSMHDEAENAAVASLCAGEQNKFWEYHDYLFENQGILGVSYYYDLAYELGLDYDQFDACYQSRKYYSYIRKDMIDAQEYGITGTPAFVIDGEVVIGLRDFDYISNRIDDLLN